MSEAFPSVVAKVDIRKYIDQMEEEMSNIAVEAGPGKTPQEVEAAQTRIQALLRKQSQELSKELGVSGSHVLVFMLSSTILTTAWLSFAIKRETLDMSKPFDRRITLTDMLNSLDLAIANIIAAGSNYADMSKK